MMVACLNAAIHKPTSRPVRSRFARGWLLWLLNDIHTSHRSAKTGALPSHRACGFAASTESLLLTAAAMPATPPVSRL